MARVSEDDRKNILVEEKSHILFFYIQRILFKSSFEYVYPLGLMALAAFIDERGYIPGVFSGTVTEAVAVIERETKKQPISAIGLYCDFENRSVVENFSRQIKKKWNIPVIVGGPQAIALDKDFMISSQCVAVARGEGEYTLLELLEYIVHGKGRLQDIEGITYLDEKGCLVSNPNRNLISELDTLPFQNLSHSLTQPKNNFSVLTGRGCPFHCAFCYEGGTTKTVRLRSVKNVIAEIKQLLLQNPHARYIWFSDDTFTLNTQRILEFCEELHNLRQQRDFVWFCEGHPSTLINHPNIIKKMVEAGLVRMQIGIESGSPRVIEQYRKQTTLDQIEEVVHMCCEAGLPQLCGNIIIGGAGETEETIEETWEYVNKLLSVAPGMLDITLTLFTPFPCTFMTTCPEKFGLNIIDFDALTSVDDYPMAETKEMNLSEISSARKNFALRILNRMNELLNDGSVAYKNILQHYQLNDSYGISSVWHSVVYTKRYFLHRQYTLLVKSSAANMKDIDASKLENWHPLRVFSLWNSISFEEGFPEISQHVLSPLEYEVMLFCSGKLKLKQLIDIICQKYSEKHENYEETKQIVMDILKEFAERHWVVFTPY